MKRKKLLGPAGLAITFAAFAGHASANEAEDQSAEYQADMAEIAAQKGLADADSTVKIHENGMMSAMVGTSKMKMLVVRKNDDGTFSYGHVENADEAEAFIESDDSELAAEEE